MSTMLVMAGGTGGHVYPALAVAELLRQWGVRIVWLGTRNGLEARVVPAAGFEMEWISIRGVRGAGWRRWMMMPLRMAVALMQAARAVFRHRPDALLGMGGFVSAPGGLAAWLLRRPLLIHESNAVAGTTNRVLARLSKYAMTGFPGVLHGAKVHHVGNPVRSAISSLDAPLQRLAARSGPVRLLVLGGSRGAAALNRLLVPALLRLSATQRLQVWHQTGADAVRQVRTGYEEVGIEARVVAYIDDMAEAYAWADLAVCRAGAMTVSELSAAGLGAVLIPYPYAIDDHQTANARYLEAQGAGVVIAEHDLNADRFSAVLQPLLTDRSRIVDMAKCARQLALPDATRRVAQLCLDAINA